MKKSAIFLFLFIAAVMTGCIKNNVKLSDVISPLTFSSKKILADGTTLVTVTATLNAKADSARRMVTFTASSGSFLGGTDSTITKNAVFVNQNLVAQVQFKAPYQPGTITIKAQVNLANDLVGYQQKDTINAAPSVPAKITLSASAFAVQINYGSEVTFMGTLTNSAGNPVSVGNQVIFGDLYDNQTQVNGRFRQVKATSDTSSMVSAIYSPGAVAIGRNIYVSCYLLGPTGIKLPIGDSVLITTISN
jgi:hypothetical protein